MFIFEAVANQKKVNLVFQNIGEKSNMAAYNSKNRSTRICTHVRSIIKLVLHQLGLPINNVAKSLANLNRFWSKGKQIIRFCIEV